MTMTCLKKWAHLAATLAADAAGVWLILLFIVQQNNLNKIKCDCRHLCEFDLCF